ncbi:hypothetical protein NLJ89_g5036 [Agrocybe chaxingu]|uniref:Uncharacterized protein n=1 Tax=Agrocybe chaxingu TaxID=84603 RepID=A0A9W8MVZ2_9AGAR|nr:hypothetical protein NLJ89_g5036 [Agrocybe chaxingu]
MHLVPKICDLVAPPATRLAKSCPAGMTAATGTLPPPYVDQLFHLVEDEDELEIALVFDFVLLDELDVSTVLFDALLLPALPPELLAPLPLPFRRSSLKSRTANWRRKETKKGHEHGRALMLDEIEGEE